jgi:hypothetical protein
MSPFSSAKIAVIIFVQLARPSSLSGFFSNSTLPDAESMAIAAFAQVAGSAELANARKN